MGKKSENLKNYFLFLIYLFAKKCYPLSFPILGGHNSTRALQSSPFQKYKNLKKSQEITFKKKSLHKKNFAKKK